jgi:succinyl-diaminopimelate desuccinylase
MDLAQEKLESLGFRVKRYKFGLVDNLYARIGEARPNFCFAGHLDVVPPGEGWTSDPFAAEIRDGLLYGRGATDMKTAIAAMIAATENFLAGGAPKGSISFLLTCDEEGPAVDGTKRVLEALAAEGEKIDHCIVGEPTSEARVGDVIKNGRRGSLNVVLTMDGKQGHVAYPQRARNPVTPLVETLATLKARRLDDGAPGFDPSNLEVTSVDVGNPAHNVIPQRAMAKLNIRFNTNHTAETLLAWIDETANAAAETRRHEILTHDQLAELGLLHRPRPVYGLAASVGEGVIRYRARAHNDGRHIRRALLPVILPGGRTRPAQ